MPSLDTTPPHPPMPTQHQQPSINGSNQECQRGVSYTPSDTLSETASEPSNAPDQIGGWAKAGVGQAYGLGYSLEKKWELLNLLEKKQVQRR